MCIRDRPAEGAHRPRPATGINGRPPRKRRLGKPKVGERFAGAKGVKAGWSRASGRLACSHPIDIRTADRRARRYGYWLSGRSRKRRRSSTAYATFPLTTPCDVSYGSSNAVGRSSRIITNSKKNSAWITTKVATGKDG